MAETTATPKPNPPTPTATTPSSTATGNANGLSSSSSAMAFDAPAEEPAKAKFARAIEEAKSGAQALSREAQDRANTYRDKMAASRNDWADEAKARGEQAKERASELALEGKARASSAIAGLSKIVAENAPVLEEKLGTRFGDAARSAAQSMEQAAERLDAKDLADLADDARAYIRKSPGLAISLAAAAGFLLARAFKKSDA